MMNNFHIIIPARLESTRLKNKVLLEINGKSIVQLVYEKAQSINPLSVTVATNHKDIFDHIKYMSYTTIPSFVITLVIFFIIGLNYENSSIENLSNIQDALAKTFNINPLILLTPLLVIFLIFKNIPAVASLFFAVLLGCLSTFIFQEELLVSLLQSDPYLNKSEYYLLISSISTNFSIITENNSLNSLLNTSGMSGMLNTIWLVISAMVFGGVMESIGALKRITSSLLNLGKSTFSLFASTAGSCMPVNLTTSDQYLAIVIPGIILVIFGIIFNFQGQGMVGPESSFMYQSEDWIDYGIIISMVGVILILIGYVIEKKRQT